VGAGGRIVEILTPHRPNGRLLGALVEQTEEGLSFVTEDPFSPPERPLSVSATAP